MGNGSAGTATGPDTGAGGTSTAPQA
jgi:hypothetical protein